MDTWQLLLFIFTENYSADITTPKEQKTIYLVNFTKSATKTYFFYKN
jgi:hypothetical protein